MQTTTAENVPTEDTIEIEETDTLTFAGLGLGEVTLRALDRAGFKSPSPIQARLVPAALAGRDCLGNAPTGTGKTAAFLLPILDKIDERKNRLPQALILAPTRELVDPDRSRVRAALRGPSARFALSAWSAASRSYNQQRLLGQRAASL